MEGRGSGGCVTHADVTTRTCWDLALPAARHPVAGTATPHDVFQISTSSELLAGGFRGESTYGEIRRHGDFGVGTFDQLDGEMVAVDGRFHQLHSDGTATLVDDRQSAPFAMVTFFKGDVTQEIGAPVDHDGLHGLLSSLQPEGGDFCAIRVDGHFERVVTRTVSKQTPPYTSLAEATKDQVEREFRDVRGTLVGFRAPAFVDGVTIGGYHFHFISDDASVGGHVLDLHLLSGRVAADVESSLHVELPQQPTPP